MSDIQTVVVAENLGKPNANGRIYLPEVINAALEKAKPKIDSCRFFGFVYNAEESFEPAFVVRKLEVHEDKLIADIQFLNSLPGAMIQLAAQTNALSFTSRGTGFVGKDGVVSDYEIESITVDVKRQH